MRPTSHWLRPTYNAAAIVNRYDCGIFVCAPASTSKFGIIWSPDMGKPWAQSDRKEFGPRSGCRINKNNTDGWFRMDLRKGWIERAAVLFLKPKPAAKNRPRSTTDTPVCRPALPNPPQIDRHCSPHCTESPPSLPKYDRHSCLSISAPQSPQTIEKSSPHCTEPLGSPYWERRFLTGSGAAP